MSSSRASTESVLAQPSRMISYEADTPVATTFFIPVSQWITQTKSAAQSADSKLEENPAVTLAVSRIGNQAGMEAHVHFDVWQQQGFPRRTIPDPMSHGPLQMSHWNDASPDACAAASNRMQVRKRERDGL